MCTVTLQLLQQKAESLSQAREQDTTEHYFHLWRIKEHANLLGHAKRIRLLRRCLLAWREKQTSIAGNQGERSRCIFLLLADQSAI